MYEVTVVHNQTRCLLEKSDSDACSVCSGRCQRLGAFLSNVAFLHILCFNRNSNPNPVNLKAKN